jgi:hypothetical protein
MTPERTTVRLLADKNGVQDSLSPAVERWTRKYGDKHPLEAKLTPRRALHDRAIFVDGKGAWVLASRRSIASKPFLRREKTGESVTLRPAISRNVPGGIYEVTKQLPHNGREVRISLQKCKRRA